MSPNDVPFEPRVFFGQIASIFGGLFFMLLGSAIFYTIAVWRFRGQQVEGEIIGIRRRGDQFHTVYRYALPAGGFCEATSVQGSGSPIGRTTGRRVALRVMPDKPAEAHEAASAPMWLLASGLVGGGGWLTYYSVTAWKHSVVTWILLALAAIYAGRKLWRKLAPYLAKLRSQPGVADAWSAVPIETAETMGVLPETERLQIRQSRPNRTGAIFCVAGLVVLATAYFSTHKLILLRTGSRVQGTVLRLHADGSTNQHPGLFPEVEFRSTDGTVVRFEDRVGENPSPYKVGDRVTVLYQPGKQDTAMIDHGLGNWEPIAGLLLLGTVLTSLGIVSLRGGFGAPGKTRVTMNIPYRR
jgi:hypothetical protein